MAITSSQTGGFRSAISPLLPRSGFVQSAIDTTTPGGRLIFHLFGALGQFERDLIRERTRAGLAAALARGRRGGRKPVVTKDKLERAKALLAKGLRVREAAMLWLRIGKTALYEALNRNPDLAERPKPQREATPLNGHGDARL